MRRTWKLIFLSLLAVGVGVLWQSEPARAQLFRELENMRNFFNELAEGREPWQVRQRLTRCFYVSSVASSIRSSVY